MTGAIAAAPMVCAVGAAITSAQLRRVSRPALATWLLASLTVISVASVVWAIAPAALGFALELPVVGSLFWWCRGVVDLPTRVPFAVGVAAWTVFTWMFVAVVRYAIHWVRARSLPLGPDLVVSDEPMAFAVPGRPGRVVVSTGMLDALDADEQRVLYAHERSHLARHHSRFLFLADVSAAALPFLRPLSDSVRYSTERWADEDAAVEVGDRRIVARAIARAALAKPQVATGLAFNGGSTRSRVDAMLNPRPQNAPLALFFGAVVIGLVGNGAQLQLLVEFLQALCAG